MIVGWALVIVGVMNFFYQAPDAIKIMPVHAVIHIIAGSIGIVFRKNHQGYTLWIGIIGVLLSMLGFAGLESVTRFIDLPSGFNYIHAVLGIAGLLVYFGGRERVSGSTQSASITPKA